MTLTGTATVAQYQTALDSVTFSTTSTSTTARQISVVASDNTLTSTAESETVDITILPPTVTASGKTNTFVLGGSAVAIDLGATVGPANTDLTGATLTISSGTLQSGDTLSFTSQNGITGSYSSTTGKLTLTGTATVAQYQTALDSVTFSTTSSSTTARQISVVASDNTLTSTAASETVDVSIANGSLSGTAFDDINQNGTLDSGEPVLANITITLTGTDSSGNSVNQTALTSSSGTYSFTQLVAGTYTLTATLPSDLAGGKAVDSNSSSLGSASGLVIGAIDLASGASQTGFNFTASGLVQTYYNVNMFLASSPPLTELLNEDPVVSSLSDQSTTEATATTPQSFTITDPYVSVANLMVSGASSNTTLVPTANIVYGGSGADRTVTVTPAAGQTGTATITTTVTDPSGNLDEEAFTVTVTASAVSSSAVVSPLVSNASNQSPDDDAADDASVSPAVSSVASSSSSSTGSVSPVAKNSSAVDAALASEDDWT